MSDELRRRLKRSVGTNDVAPVEEIVARGQARKRRLRQRCVAGGGALTNTGKTACYLPGREVQLLDQNGKQLSVVFHRFVIWSALCPGLPALRRVTCQASAPRTANSQENCDPSERKFGDSL